MTSGKWPSVLLSLFHGFARRAISLSYLDFGVQTGRVPSMQSVWPKEQQAAGPITVQCTQCLDLGGLAGSLSKSRSDALQELQVQGSTSTSASRSRSRSVRNTLLPTPGTVQVCGSSAIAIALAPHLHPGGSTPTLYPSTSKTRSVRSACTAHKHTSVQSARPPPTTPSSPSSPSILIFLGAGHSLAIPPLQY